MRPLPLLAALSALVGTPAVAGEREPWSITVTDDLEIRYWVRPERLRGFEDRAVFNYLEQVNRLNLSVGRGPWTGLLQVDQVMLAANRYRLDGTLYTERDLTGADVYWPVGFGDWYANPEKIGLRHAGETVTWKLGDFYGAFGTGLALNLNRNVDIDIDTSLQGAHVLYRRGDWDLTMLVGQANRQQVFQDNPNLEIPGDRRHLVAGVRAERYGLGPAVVGAHAVAYDFVDDTGFAPSFEQIGTAPDVVVGGATTELFGVLGLDWSAEADVYAFPTPVAFGGEQPEPGYAAYASAVGYLGSTTWQLEGKRYLQAERVNAPVSSELYELAVGPTLEYERAVTEDSAAALNSNDIWGGRLRVDWTAVPGETIPYASVALFRDLDTGTLHFNETPETIAHPLVGAEVFAEHLTLIANAGYRLEWRDGGERGDRQLHGDLDVKVPLPAGLHADLAVAGEWFRWGDNAFQQADYTELETAVSVLKGSDLAVTWFTDFSGNPLIDSKGNLTERLYGALEVQVKPTSALTVKAFYGAYKSGIRCSGGQCRLLPGFEGARLSAVGTF